MTKTFRSATLIEPDLPARFQRNARNVKLSLTSLRTKLIVLAAVPLVLLVTVAAMGVQSAADARGQDGDAAGLLRLAVAADDSALALIQERRLSALPTAPDSGVLEPQRDQSDEALAALASELSSHGEEIPDEDAKALASAAEELDTLPGLRDAVDQAASGGPVGEDTADREETAGQTAGEADVLHRYSKVIGSVVALDQSFLDSPDPDVFRRFQAHRALVRAIDQVALQENLLQGSFEAGSLSPALQQELSDSVAREHIWVERFQEAATPAQLDGYSELAATPSVTTADRLRDRALAGTSGEAEEASTAMWSTAVDKKIDLLMALTADSGLALAGALGSETSASGADLLRSIGLLLAVLALSAGILLALHRLVIDPIQRLATGAQDATDDVLQAVASGEADIGPDAVLPLPQPADDELSDLADALTTMRDTILSLAADQTSAANDANKVFLDLGRRAQNLVTRQLGQIDELESRTDDADTLAGLFILDHLATRLRRQAETLSVLAGSEPPRAWARPISIVNVVRAAAAEAVDYSRVDVVQMGPGAVTGTAANEVSHLLAELIDNALTYSPPESRVAIGGERHPDGRYMVAISDAGVGMPPSQLEEVNERLTSPEPGGGLPELSTAPRGAWATGPGQPPASRHLGLYVVKQLAQRHGIAVRLVPSHLNGIRAEVALPRSLMVLPTDAQGPALKRPVSAGQLTG